MTKKNLNIITIFTIIFLSLNLFSQSRKQIFTISPTDNQYNRMQNIENNIKVISILDTDNYKELKKLDHFAAKYKNRNVTFIVITDKSNDSLYNLNKEGIRYYQFLSENENRKNLNTYQTGMYKVFPTHIVINKEGEIIYKKKGIANNIEDKLSKRIDKLLEMHGKEIIQNELQISVR